MNKQVIKTWFLVIYLLQAVYSIAQQPQWLNPKPFGGEMYDIEFFDTTRGLMVGRFGSIAITTDGAQSWELINSGTNSDLQDIEICGSQSAVIQGDTFLLRTDDGGNTFTPIGNLDSGWYYAGISLVNQNLGYAAMQDGLYAGIQQAQFGITHNGGHTWQWMDFHPIAVKEVLELDFADSLHGMAVIENSIGYTYAINTSDGGQTWDQVLFIKDNDGGITGIKLTYATNGVCYLASCIYTEQEYWDYIAKSIDNGLSWTGLSTYDPNSFIKGWHELKTYGDSIVVAMDYNLGCSGTIAKNILISHDAGLTWDWATKPNDFAVSEPSAFGFRNRNSAVLWVANGDHHQLASTNNLNYFQPVEGCFSAFIKDMIFKNEVQYMLSDESADGYLILNSILKSEDAGLHWNTLPKPSGEYNNVLGLSFSDDLNGFAVVRHDTCLFRTFDGGYTWQEAQPDINPRPGEICTFGYGCSWYFNMEHYKYPNLLPNQLVRSSDMGSTWALMPIPNDTLIHMQFLDPDTGFLFGGGKTTANGGYYSTHDGAQTWEFHDLGIAGPVTGKMLNSQMGFVKSADESKLYFVNGDTTELFFEVDSLYFLPSITTFDFTSGNWGYVITKFRSFATWSSLIHYTSDGGQTWQTYGPYSPLNGVKTFYDGNGYAYGDYGVLLQLGNGFPVGQNTLPGSSNQAVAWPNPATTGLQITLPSFAQGGAQLSISNGLGEVVLQQQVSGKVVNVAINGLPAGFYVYTLSNATQKATGKFVVK